jgi:hypothetical protein
MAVTAAAGTTAGGGAEAVALDACVASGGPVEGAAAGCGEEAGPDAVAPELCPAADPGDAGGAEADDAGAATAGACPLPWTAA